MPRKVREWIEIHQAEGEPLPPATAGKSYPGKFVVRVGKDLHQALAVEALRQGESLNACCVRRLREDRAQDGDKGRVKRVTGQPRSSGKR